MKFMIFLILSQLAHAAGARDALKDNSLTNEEMVRYAIEGEYLMKNRFLMTLKKYKDHEMVTKLIKEEDRHISMLMEVSSKYLSTPVSEEEVVKSIKISSITLLAFKAMLDGEKENLAMYEKFLKEDLPSDLRDTFSKVHSATVTQMGSFKRPPKKEEKKED